ncbi:glycoside hydrolase family 3 C-terminal domain-containing protein [Streptomyces sp. NPDC090053]|uniref:glycoside hydrolase family 3 C-terminal domain-containing protein n=1 Tax=Streptomyces sp. NPDC090053 TaxID=3365932 RepID=UPI00380CA430
MKQRSAPRRRVLLAVLSSMVCVTSLAGFSRPAATAPRPVYLDTHYSFEARAADLVSRMNFGEKADQLNTNTAPAIPRLGVQDYTYWSEGAHGINYMGAGFNNPAGSDHPPATAFPAGIAATMTWDKDLMYQETTAISDEVRGYLDKSLFGVAPNNIGGSKTDYGSLTFWAPTVNMDRDPRWGRNDEGFGEDPYLVAQMAGAFVNGYQGNTETGQSANGYLKVAATAKHFALNNVEDMRKAANSAATDADIRDYYTAQFKSLIGNSHVAGLMTSYNAVNGTPAVANTYTANQIAQRTYGFSGYTTGDCGAVATVYDLPTADSAVAGHNWAPPGWTTDGLGDNSTWTNTSTGAKISAQAGAEAYALRAGSYLNCYGFENSAANLRAAIDAGILSEGVIDTALTRTFTMRMSTGEFDPASSVPYTSATKANIESPEHQALAEKVAANDLVLLKNDHVAGSSKPLLPADPAKLNNVVILGDMADKMTYGDYWNVPTHQTNAVQGLTKAIKAANPHANILFDAAGTSSTATSPATLSASTRAAIRNADLVVPFVGMNTDNAGENHDLTSLAMPGNYTSLINQVSALGNPRTALAIQSAGPVKIDDVQGKFPAILFSGYNGQAQGTALADVMFGKQNPSGHLDFTWYKDESQLPAMDNYGLDPAATGGLGRTYQYFTGTPTYPFGYGLSYTDFAYSPATVDKRSVTADGTVDVRFTVRNKGSVPGAAVAQLYAATPHVTAPAGATAVPLPAKRLAGFRKTRVLAPGERQQITLPVKIADLAFWDSTAMKSVVYEGTYQFQVGTSASHITSSADVSVTGALTPEVQHVTVQPEAVNFTAGDTIDLAGKNQWIKDDTDPAQQLDRNMSVMADGVVEAANSDGSFVDLSKAKVRYSTSDASVATVNHNGLVTTVGSGVATIRVTVNGVTGSAAITVHHPPAATGSTAGAGSPR